MAHSVASAGGGSAGRNRPAGEEWTGRVLVLAAAALAVAPLLIRGTSCGHDFDFHLVSWFDALNSWRHGIVYPHWAPSPNYNAGEPRFVFYPPLTWMLGAVLGAVLPWSWVPNVLVFLLLAGTGLATRALARQAMADAWATLAGCIAIFSGYTLFTVYERSAFAELTGGFWIPLMFLLVMRKSRLEGPGWRRALDGSAALLALVIAGAWLSNAPLGVMACYALATFAVAVAVLDRSWAPVLRAAAGAALGLGLSAFYLVPAAVEQRWVDIRQATDDPGLAIENSFLFGHHADPQLALHDVELRRVSWIAVLMIAVALAGVLVSWRRRTLPGGWRWWVPLALVPVAVLVLQLPLSLPLWNALPKLRFLQFPWRWLIVVEAPLGILVAAVIRTEARRMRIVAITLCGAAFLCVAVFAGRSFFQVCDEEDAIAPMVQAYRAGNGFQGVDEYAPPGADDSLAPQDLPAACLVSDPTIELGKTTADDPQPDWAPDQKSCAAVLEMENGTNSEHWRARGWAPQPGYLVLRLRRYPAWAVRVNGQPVTSAPDREDGLMAVPVLAGPVEVTADWTSTPDERQGRIISVVSLALLTGVGAMARRRRRAQLK